MRYNNINEEIDYIKVSMPNFTIFGNMPVPTPPQEENSSEDGMLVEKNLKRPFVLETDEEDFETVTYKSNKIQKKRA